MSPSGYLLSFVTTLIQVLSLAILVRVLLSWIDPTGNMRVTQILRDITEPVLGPLRKVLPSMGMIDLSPMIAMLLLQVIGQMIQSAAMR